MNTNMGISFGNGYNLNDVKIWIMIPSKKTQGFESKQKRTQLK